MKKVWMLILAATLLLGGCGTDPKAPEENTQAHVQQTEAKEEETVCETTVPPETEPPRIESVDLTLNQEISTELEAFDTVHTYRITITGKGLLEMEFSAPVLDGQHRGEYHLALYTPEGYHLDEPMWTRSPTAGSENLMLLRMRLGAGDYYFTVSSDHTDVVQGGYILIPHFTDESGDDAVECEWNDTEETATPLEVGMRMKGNTNTNSYKYFDNDVDYYVFTLEEEKVVRLDFELFGFFSTYWYEVGGVFGGYEMSKGWGHQDEYSTLSTKTMRLEPGTYYIDVTRANSVSVEESADYYLTIVEVD